MLNKKETSDIVKEALENALYRMNVARWDRQTILAETAVIINDVYKVKKGINGNLLEDPEQFITKVCLGTGSISYNDNWNLLSDRSFLLAEKLLIWTPMESEIIYKKYLWGGGNNSPVFRCCTKSNSSLHTLLHRSRLRHHYELTIPGTVDDIQEKLKAGQPGIYPYFGKERKGKEKPFLCALIIKERDAFFYCKRTEEYYEFRKDRK